MRYETQKLLEVWKKHGVIIVGVDFDDTIYPLTTSEYIRDRCNVVHDLLHELKKAEVMILCLYTVADNQSLRYKGTLMNLWNIFPDHMNSSPVKIGNGSKPFFNILLDDKAGLNEAIVILQEFLTQIK